MSSATNPTRRSPADRVRAVQLDALPGARSLSPLPDREPPTERRIFAAGPLATTKGTFLFTPRSAESVMAAYTRRGVRCWYDFNHQGTIPGAKAPAAAFMDLEVRDAGSGPELWAVNIRWADDAAAEIRNGSWGYDSAWFLYDEATMEITELCNVALTNDPATLNLSPLVAVAQRAAMLGTCPDTHPRLAAALENTTMAETEAAPPAPMKCAICADEMAPDAKLGAAHAACLDDMMKKMGEKMQAAGAVAGGASLSRATITAGLDRSLAVFAALSRELGTTDQAAMLGTVRGWKAGADRAAAAEAALSKIQGEAALSKFDALVEQGRRDAKLTPAQVSSEWIKGMRAEPVAGARQLEAFLSAAAPQVVTQSTAATPPATVGDAGAVTLSRTEIEIAARCGTDVPLLIRQKAQQSVGGQAILTNQPLFDAEVARVQRAIERFKAGDRAAAE